MTNLAPTTVAGRNDTRMPGSSGHPAAGDLTAELAEFARMQDMQFSADAFTYTVRSIINGRCV